MIPDRGRKRRHLAALALFAGVAAVILILIVSRWSEADWPQRIAFIAFAGLLVAAAGRTVRKIAEDGALTGDRATRAARRYLDRESKDD